MFQRIMIIGRSGSGKITFAKTLGEKVSLELWRMIFRYKTRYVLEQLENAKDKKIYIVRNRKEAAKALREIAGQK